MKVTVIPIIIRTLRIVTKELVEGQEDLEIRRPVETIQTTALSRSVFILRRVLKTCCHLNSSEKPSANAGVKKSQNNSNNNNDNNDDNNSNNNNKT